MMYHALPNDQLEEIAQIMKIAVHPLAALIPEMDDGQYEELRADIERNGLLDAIVLHEHMVLDGRHRLRACEEIGVEPRFVEFAEFDAPSPVEFVVSKNLKRRHLTPSQRAALVTEFLPAYEAEAKQRQGTRTDLATSGSTDPEVAKEPVRAREKVAALVGVSGASVDRAKRVQREDPEVFEQVKSGERSLHDADNKLRARAKANGESRYVTSGHDHAAPGFEIESERDELRAQAHKRKIIDVVSTLSGFARGIDSIDVNRARAAISDEELREWDRSLGSSFAKLRQFRSHLREGRS
jgi:ParB-like chromosome segregation protein Spo0J